MNVIRVKNIAELAKKFSKNAKYETEFDEEGL